MMQSALVNVSNGRLELEFRSFHEHFICSKLSHVSMLELLVSKNLIQRTSQRVKWTSGARVMLNWMLHGWQKYGFRSIHLCKMPDLTRGRVGGVPARPPNQTRSDDPTCIDVLNGMHTYASLKESHWAWLELQLFT